MRPVARGPPDQTATAEPAVAPGPAGPAGPKASAAVWARNAPVPGSKASDCWLDWTLVRDLSSDGSRILFDETGVGGGELHAVYLRGTDGSPASEEALRAVANRTWPSGSEVMIVLVDDPLAPEFLGWTRHREGSL